MLLGPYKQPAAQATYTGDKKPYGATIRPLHIFFLLIGGLAVLGLVIPDVYRDEQQVNSPSSTSTETISLHLPQQGTPTKEINLSTIAAVPKQALENKKASKNAEGSWHEIVVKRGDTLSSIFSRQNILGQLSTVIAAAQDKNDLRYIHPGQHIRLRIHDNILEELIYELDNITSLRITRHANGFTGKRVTIPLETRQSVARGKISHSLYRAGVDAGLSERLIMDLINLFGWDIDFALDIRQGDSFTVLYEDFYNNGERVKAGKINAAEFVNQGRIYQAFSYTDSKGRTEYFSSTGRSMRKAFLRTPVSFARISSRFSLGRKHPILNKIRAHRGVDYSAPTGTPVKATSDGRIIFLGRKGGYGKTIILKHGEKYSTLYAHLSRYKRKLKRGERVKQGQIIGYVGKTGLATGPHLHYEFRVNGVHRNPLTVKLPSAKPLPSSELTEFNSNIKPLLAQLEYHRRADIALNNEQLGVYSAKQ